MIKSITVTNFVGDSLKMELRNPASSGFIITNIKGLGPGKANVNVTEVSTNDGGVFNSARQSTRNIVLSLTFDPSQDIETLRRKSYRFFPLKRNLKLRIETDTRIAEITGYVESNDPSIFSSREGSDISIICPDPAFYSAEGDGTKTTLFYGIEPMFEFPFSNESLTENLIEFSSIMQNSERVIIYDGDADIGMTITLDASGPVTNIGIYDTENNTFMRLDTSKIEAITGKGVDSGDSIIVCTVRGKKTIRLLRAGVSYNILNCLDKNSKWLELSKGDNRLAFSAETGFTNLAIRVTNQIVYEGM